MTTSTLVLALTMALAGPAVASDPPPHDDFDAARAIAPIPFTDWVDTSGATEADDDPDCYGAGPTVWYSLEVDETMSVEVNTFGSDYDTTLSAYLGERGDLEQIRCNDDAGESLQSRIRFLAEAGTTYYLMVGAYGSGEGGNLVLNALEGPESGPVEMAVNVDSVAQLNNRTNTVTVTGTLSCSGADFVNLFGELTQRAGRVYVRGWMDEWLPCEDQPFSVQVTGRTGVFSGGQAELRLETWACGEEDCVFDMTHHALRLRGGGR